MTSTIKTLSIPATFMRGGTSKGVFFLEQDLQTASSESNQSLDEMLLKLMGSPDPYGKQMDGLGGGSSSTSKAAIICKSEKGDHDVDYLFGQVSIDSPLVDWSGNCGNLTAAVGYYAVFKGLIDQNRLTNCEHVVVKVWQRNINKTILVTVPLENGKPKDYGDFCLDGVTFPSAEIRIEFIEPVSGKDSLFPTGNTIDSLAIPVLGNLQVTLINAGIPSIFVAAGDVKLKGIELAADLNGDKDVLNLIESVRAHGALKMGLIDDISGALQRQHTPKVIVIGVTSDYESSAGNKIKASDIDITARAVSMGQFHHAIMATAAVATSIAAEIEGTIVNRLLEAKDSKVLRIGHSSGITNISAEVSKEEKGWEAKKVSMSRSARLLMDGNVYCC